MEGLGSKGSVQFDETKVAGVIGRGVGAREDGPVVEWPESCRDEAVPGFSGVVTGEGDNILRVHHRGGVVQREVGPQLVVGQGGTLICHHRHVEVRAAVCRALSTGHQHWQEHQHSKHTHDWGRRVRTVTSSGHGHKLTF